MRVLFFFVGAVAAAGACHTEQVQPAPMCSDPCCGGSSALLDCGENPNVSCTESGDPCTAQSYGCVGGVFFKMPQASLPASCPTDAGAAVMVDDGSFSSGDDAAAAADGTDGAATTDGGPDAAPDGPSVTADGAADAAPDAGATDACGDATCAM
jgi:hypothetical protein